MSEPTRELKHPPVIEAVLDIDCDLPPGLKIEDLEEPTRRLYGAEYPKTRKRQWLEHQIKTQEEEPPRASLRSGMEGYMFLHPDEKQLVQVRRQGFSFNRLAPYTTLDDYLPEMQRTWSLFCQLAHPLHLVAIRLRYINRIPLKLVQGHVDLDQYLKVGPRLPDEDRLTFSGFLNQYSAVDRDTGHNVMTIITSQQPEPDALPIVLDITASADVQSDVQAEPDNWQYIDGKIQSLRELKNLVFYKTLEDRCLQPFQ